MCNFKSAIVVKDEREKFGFRLLLSPWTESHSELCDIFGLNDNDTRIDFAKIEFSPDTIENSHLPEKYNLKIDEDRTPDWFDNDIREKVIEKMTFYIKSILITGKHRILIGKQFIVCPNANIKLIKNCIIYSINSAQIQNVYDSVQIENVYGSAQIENVYDSVQIQNVSGSAQIENVYGSAQIRNVSGSAQIENVYDSVQIKNVYDSVQIQNVSGSAQIKNVSGSAQIENVSGSAQIENVSGSAQIKNVYGSAKIINDLSKKK